MEKQKHASSKIVRKSCLVEHFRLSLNLKRRVYETHFAVKNDRDDSGVFLSASVWRWLAESLNKFEEGRGLIRREYEWDRAKKKAGKRGRVSAERGRREQKGKHCGLWTGPKQHRTAIGWRGFIGFIEESGRPRRNTERGGEKRNDWRKEWTMDKRAYTVHCLLACNQLGHKRNTYTYTYVRTYSIIRPRPWKMSSPRVRPANPHNAKFPNEPEDRLANAVERIRRRFMRFLSWRTGRSLRSRITINLTCVPWITRLHVYLEYHVRIGDSFLLINQLTLQTKPIWRRVFSIARVRISHECYALDGL